MSMSDSVSVALRVRPLVRSERERGCQLAVERSMNGIPQVIVNRTEPFTFNYVFDEHDTQKAVYDACVADMLEKLLSGFNATILAYGQTGSGKTFTMGTAFSGNMDDDVGLIPRAIYDIFAHIKALEGKTEFIVKCSFMELYQEQLFDLLSSNGREESVVDLREDKTGIVVAGLTELAVSSATEVTDYLVKGSSRRAVASTAMNQQSSRSHAIFTVKVIATKLDEKRAVTTSKFHLVDLAGSERCTKTMATGDRFKEGVNINKGLLALGNVISALGTGQGSGYVRYRDSKLTRLLQDSLGGNSITLMIACISPADYNVPETLSTLRYANRARQIKNKPVINQDPHAAEVNQLKDVIQKLRVELLSRGGGMSASLSTAVNSAGLTDVMAQGSSAEELRLKTQLKELQLKNRSLQQQLQQTLHDLAANEMRAHISESAQKKLKTRNVELKEMINRLSDELKPNVNAEQLHHMQELSQLIEHIDVEHDRTESEIRAHNKMFFTSDSPRSATTSESESSGNGANNEEVQELLQPHSDEYTKKQIHFNEELRLISRQLDLKEELHQRVCLNFNKMYAIADEDEEKVKEYENKINELESEKHDLMDKLKHVKENASAKLAEERRKRLQTLEHEISDMKRKIQQQAKMLKLREKETQKIINLSSEIQQMKESKVKLIRTMRQESEAFRQWKMVREKELMQLKNKDRKRENEMARKEALHSKQRNVLKRKCEEALAINKRLKDALERQSAAQAQRQKSSKEPNAAKLEQTSAWVERELELIFSLIDAEHSLEQLMEDRTVVSGRLADVESQLEENPHDPKAQKEHAGLAEELEMRNAQIADLQQKVCAADLETRMRSLAEGLQNIVELRAVVRQLVKSIAQMRREHAQRTLEQRLQLEEQRLQLNEAEERYHLSSKRMRLAEMEYKENIAERERTFEEKIAVLLRGRHVEATTPEQEGLQQIIDDILDKKEALERELMHYKKLVEAKQRQTKKIDKLEINAIADIGSSDDDEYNYSDRNSDPDWALPKITCRRRNKKNSRASRKNVSAPSALSNDVVNNSATDTSSILGDTSNANPNDNPVAVVGAGANGNNDNINNTIDSNSSNNNMLIASIDRSIAAIANASVAGEHKRKSKGCKCRKNCLSKRCGCRSRNETCTENCFCKINCNNMPNGGGGNAGRGTGEKNTGSDENTLEEEDENDYDDRDGDGDGDGNDNDDYSDKQQKYSKENRVPSPTAPAAATTATTKENNKNVNNTIVLSTTAEESPTNNNSNNDNAFLMPTDNSGMLATPKAVARTSVLNFSTPSSKRKFFNI